MVSQVSEFGLVSRALPQPTADGMEGECRLGRYRDAKTLNLIPTKHVLAGEGTYYAVASPAPGTGIAYGSAGTQTSFSDTVPFILVKNNDVVGGKRVCLDYLKIIQIGGIAPATTTSFQLAVKIDNINRQNTAGTLTPLTPQSVNMDSPSTSISQWFVPAGAVATIPASSSGARLIGRAQLKGGPVLVLDEYSIAFGMVDSPPQGGYLTSVSSYVTRMPPLELGPQQWAVFYAWLPSATTNPFTFEFEAGQWER